MSFSIIFLLNSIGALVVILAGIYGYHVLSVKSPAMQRLHTFFGGISIFYTLLFSLFFTWTFDILTPITGDFILFETLVVVVSSLGLLYFIYHLNPRKSLWNYAWLYIVLIIAINIGLTFFYVATRAISYLLMTVLFLEMISSRQILMKRAGYTGLVYCLVSLGLTSLLFLGVDAIVLPWFIPFILFGVVVFFVADNMSRREIVARKKEHHVSVFTVLESIVNLFIFIVCIVGFMGIGTIAVHEMGHALVGHFYGCSSIKSVIYDIGMYPHTELICEQGYNNVMVTLGGLIITTLLGLVLYAIGQGFVRTSGLLIASFGLFISTGDLTDLLLSSNIILVAVVFSVIIGMLTLIKMSKDYILSQSIFYTDDDMEGMKAKDRNRGVAF